MLSKSLVLIWSSVPEMRCDISLRRENCKVQLFGLTALGHSWSQSVCGWVDVGVRVADVHVRVCVYLSSGSHPLSPCKLLIADVMKYDVCQLIMLERMSAR